jgi:hypothetical protein
MPHETQHPAEIERDLARERNELAGTLEELRDRLSFEGAWRRAGRHLRENGSDYGQSFGNMVRDKPLALALTTIGLTWLIFGPATRSSTPTVRDRSWQPRSVDADPGDAMPAAERAERASSSSYETATGASLDGRSGSTGDRTASSYSAAQTHRPSGLEAGAVGTKSDISNSEGRQETPETPPSFQSERPDLSEPSSSVRTPGGRSGGADGHDNDRNEANS